jgi:hypothetical protein
MNMFSAVPVNEPSRSCMLSEVYIIATAAPSITMIFYVIVVVLYRMHLSLMTNGGRDPGVEQ